jgi:hypothetical protein
MTDETNPNIKPRTIPEALGLSDRKVKAIYETVSESMKNGNTIDTMLDLLNTFPDKSEGFFALYVIGTKVGARKAEEQFKQAVPDIAKQGVMIGQMMAIHQLKEAEDAGVIKVVRGDGVAPVKDNETSVPDDILYGRNIDTVNDEPEPVEKPKPSKTTEDDRMYG